MCDYTGKHFGASYIDACCIDGFLWDLDSCDGPGGPLHTGGDEACPKCNTFTYLENAAQEAVETCWGQSMRTLFSGGMILEGALRIAEAVAPDDAARWKSMRGSIAVFDWPDREGVLAGRVSPETITEITLVL